jgi:hypothetical protein
LPDFQPDDYVERHLGEGSAEKMSNSQFSVTHEDFQNYSWQEVIENASSKQCHNYYNLFFGKAAELEKAGDERGCRVFRFLGAITSLHPTYENEDEPYLCVVAHPSTLLHYFNPTGTTRNSQTTTGGACLTPRSKNLCSTS